MDREHENPSPTATSDEEEGTPPAGTATETAAVDQLPDEIEVLSEEEAAEARPEGETEHTMPVAVDASPNEYSGDRYSNDEFEEMLSMYDETLKEVSPGEIVNAKVLRKTDAAVVLDFGFKSEGLVAKDEFKDAETLEPGDEVEVLLEHLEDEDGYVVLSKKKADFLRVWEKIKHAYESDEPVEGTLAQKIKGGMTVDLMGVDAFLPGSQVALRRVPNLEDLIGETYHFKILKLNKRRRNIVISRRVLLEEKREKQKEHLVKELLVGQVREGLVKNNTDFGAFIDLGGMDGLLHITDMSWGRVGHPSEVVSIGENVDVKVLDIDWDRERISLGYKQLLPYPWTDIDKKYPVGSRVKGRVVSITNYGAFVELEKGVEGLVHISEMSWTRNVKHPSNLVSIGDEIECVVLRVDPDDEKISLGMKQIEEDPWLALPLKYPAGTRITGIVRNLTSFGAFVEIEPGIDGLVHVSDMSWTKRIDHPSEVLQKGADVEVVVLNVDAENKRISLGLKQLDDDPWPTIVVEYAEGVETEATVTRVLDKGIVVDLGDDIEGFVPASHSSVDAGEDLDDYFEEGDPIELRVLESDASDRRIVLEVTGEPEKKAEAEPEEEAGEEEAEPEAEGDDEPEAEAEDEEEPEAEAEDAEAEAEEDEEPEAEADEPEPEAEEDEEPTAEAAEPEPDAEAEEDEEPEAEAEVAEAEADEGEEPESEAGSGDEDEEEKE